MYICIAIRRKAGAFAAVANLENFDVSSKSQGFPFAGRVLTFRLSGILLYGDYDPGGRGPLVYMTDRYSRTGDCVCIMPRSSFFARPHIINR